ncbi:MAG: hypothetical protein COA96_09015 [SAR86 cluster bacterium]|uniref:Uncharacterized protein n=1 Tax=SAR86 cluster bacterium TaxID=2030880 RepID=A0A2A5AZE1_9GAMM|nr:MAG: hypothetical protein COA96_09015 [SAR86 cluster bacterium]
MTSQHSQTAAADKLYSEKTTTVHSPRKQRLEESIEKREKLHMAIVIFGCIFIGIRLFTTLGSTVILNQTQIADEERRIAQQTLCVQKFWEIATVLQNGEEPSDSLNCEDPTFINVITHVGDDIIVTHPRPDLIGFSELYVSRSNPVPTVTVLVL